jgi:tRNA dimethylallyltransferase
VNSVQENVLIVVCGPTASGKTAAAIELAKKYKTEIISFDSRQFYKEMSIGTAKPSKEELAEAKHHFIDNISINEEWNAGTFEKAAIKKLNELFEKHKIVIAVGGSGLYLNALLFGFDDMPLKDENLRKQMQTEFEEKGIEFLQEKIKVLDPEFYEEGEIKNPQRVMRAIEVSTLSGKPYSEQKSFSPVKRNFKLVLIGLHHKREKLYDRINLRVDKMIDAGLLEEVKSLLPYRNHNALQTVGYKELFEHLDGKCSLEVAVDKIKQNTRNYAKRQTTWFKNQYENVIWSEPYEITKTL